MSPSVEPQRATSARAWWVLALVFLFMVINYADKAVIGLASIPIMRDLGLNHREFGLLGSAFFFLFALSGVAVGFIANRHRAKSLLSAMALIWGAALLPVSVIAHFPGLLASRIVLGAAEGPAFPVAVHALYKWFEDARRPFVSSVLASGAAFGTGLIAPLITWIIVRFGWHRAFGLLGLAGLVWALIWQLSAAEGPLERELSHGKPGHRDGGSTLLEAVPKVAYRHLLLSRTAVGVYVAGFAVYWLIALNLVWLANYLIKVLQFPPQRAAWVIALPAFLQMLLSPLLAALSQRLSRLGYSSRLARGLLSALCVSGSGLALMALPFAGAGIIEVALIGVSFSLGTVIFPLGAALIGEIAPPRQRGAALAVTNSLQTLAGLAAPVAMGLLVDVSTDAMAGFRLGYLYAGALVTVLGIAAAALIDPLADLRRFRGRDAVQTQFRFGSAPSG